jgi:hypothetical protein
MSSNVGLFCGSNCIVGIGSGLVLYSVALVHEVEWHICVTSPLGTEFRYFGSEINMLYDYIGRTGVSSFTLWIFSLLMYMCTVLTSFNRRERQSNTYSKIEF